MRFGILQLDIAERSSPAELIANIHLILFGKHDGNLLFTTHPPETGQAAYSPHQP